jgi:methylenetetrahydrofolate dehydrogenase (NADP+)/methenyltetrahydrofolate cyclohydrolase
MAESLKSRPNAKTGTGEKVSGGRASRLGRLLEEMSPMSGANVIDGNKMRDAIVDEVGREVAKLLPAKPVLAVVLVGGNPASAKYVANKEKACHRAGIITRDHKFDDISEAELLALVKKLDADSEVTGILVQLPLPAHIDKQGIEKIIAAISPKKDVDGFTAENIAKLEAGKDGLRPATPLGVMEILKRLGVSVKGKTVAVVGQGATVGKPLARMLEHAGAHVIKCNSKTVDLGVETRKADIIVSAVGRKPKLITADMVREGAIVIDVGINVDESGKTTGDVDYERVKEKLGATGWITPMPGGTGPMTIAMLIGNILKAYKMQHPQDQPHRARP